MLGGTAGVGLTSLPCPAELCPPCEANVLQGSSKALLGWAGHGWLCRELATGTLDCWAAQPGHAGAVKCAGRDWVGNTKQWSPKLSNPAMCKVRGAYVLTNHVRSFPRLSALGYISLASL